MGDMEESLKDTKEEKMNNSLVNRSARSCGIKIPKIYILKKATDRCKDARK